MRDDQFRIFSSGSRQREGEREFRAMKLLRGPNEARVSENFGLAQSTELTEETRRTKVQKEQ